MSPIPKIDRLLRPRTWIIAGATAILLGATLYLVSVRDSDRSVEPPPEIVEAYRRGDRVTMEAILEDDPSQADARVYYEGDTLLHSAVQKGETEVILLLLRYGADSRAPGADGTTPLDIAHARGQEDLIGMLTAR